MPTIHIPTPLRPYVEKQESVEVAGSTVREALSDLTTRYGELRKHLYNDEGRLRSCQIGDRSHSIPAQTYVDAPPRRTGAVVDSPSADDDVEAGRLLPRERRGSRDN